MPELPEVETVRRVVEPQITGCTVTEVLVLHTQVVAHPSVDVFCEKLRGQRIRAIVRRGKFLQIVMEGGARLVLHLRMTGQLLVTPEEQEREKHTHLVLTLEDAGGERKHLRYLDVRRFGRFWFLGAEEEEAVTGMDRLGPEPFSPELTAAYLARTLNHRRIAIKEGLLDQHVVAGIGNIYADEILFSTGIHPETPCCRLAEEDWEKLAERIPALLADLTEKNAISPEAYFRSRGKEYRNTPYLKIYGHGGEACPRCGDELLKTRVGGRSSVFCPHCQKER